MIEEDKAITDFNRQKKRHDWKAGRKFIAFLLCLAALIILSIMDKIDNVSDSILWLFALYVTGNVAQKFNKGGSLNDR